MYIIHGITSSEQELLTNQKTFCLIAMLRNGKITTYHKWNRDIISERLVLDLPTPEGWEAELTWVAGWLHAEMFYPPAVSHPSKYY